MKVKFEVIYWCECGNYPHPHLNHKKRNNVYQYNEKIDNFCCDDMENAYKEDFIIFGAKDDNWSDKNINITHCSPWPDGASWSEMPISFCPFCASKIDIENI